MNIRDAVDEDWPKIWPIVLATVRTGETYAWNPDGGEEAAQSWWMRPERGRTFVAVEDDGNVLGTAKSGPNQGGGGSHVGTASFMVGADHGGRGVGRALAEHVLDEARADGFRSMQFNAVVETNVHAVRLWQSLGFEILTTIPEGFRHPTEGYVGLHVMWRSLELP
ncbi:MAG: N-acetyltransferase family protein [Aeromicrobium sp.]